MAHPLDGVDSGGKKKTEGQRDRLETAWIPKAAEGQHLEVATSKTTFDAIAPKLGNAAGSFLEGFNPHITQRNQAAKLPAGTVLPGDKVLFPTQAEWERAIQQRNEARMPPVPKAEWPVGYGEKDKLPGSPGSFFSVLKGNKEFAQALNADGSKDLRHVGESPFGDPNYPAELKVTDEQLARLEEFVKRAKHSDGASPFGDPDYPAGLLETHRGNAHDFAPAQGADQRGYPMHLSFRGPAPSPYNHDLSRLVARLDAFKDPKDHSAHLQTLDEIASLRRQVIEDYGLSSLGFEQRPGDGGWANPADYSLTLQGENLVVGGDRNGREFVIAPDGTVTMRDESK